MPADDLRGRYAEALRQAFGHAITAEWICCDPPQRGHKLCKKGHAALRMVTALLTDDPESHPERSPVLDALLTVRDAELERLRGELATVTDYGIKHRDERDEQRRRAEQAEAAITHVRELHSPRDRGAGPECMGCKTKVTFTRYENCKTLAALDASTTKENERCTCGETACESELCDCDATPCPVNHRAEEAEAERDEEKKRVDWLRGHAEWLSNERDALKAATERARERLQAALDAWEIEHEYNRDRARRKGYTHNQTAAEAYGDAIKAATEAIAALDAPETPGDAEEATP